MAKRVRLGSEEWRDVLARQLASGLSVSNFCAREGLSEATLYYWRAKLRPVARTKPAVKVPGSGAFVDLGEVGRSNGRFEIRLELGGGVILHLARS